MAIFFYTDKDTDSPQPPVGKKDQWIPFLDFQGSPLHSRFTELIAPHIDNEEIINSGQLGKKILSELQDCCDPLIDDVNPSLLGSLFGMTLWNQLAIHHRNWRFLKEKKDPRRKFSSTLYFLES